MKYCPSCQTNYADDTLRFCLQDGTQLAELLDQSAPTISLTNSDTLVLPKRVEPLEQIQPTVQSRNWEQSEVTRVSSLQPEPQKSNTAMAVLLTAVGMLVLFGLVGTGAWLYLKDDKTEVAQNSNINSLNSSNQIADSNKNPKVSPSPPEYPKNSQPSPSPISTATPIVKPPSEFNPEVVKKDVSDQIYLWKSAAESRNLNAYMSNYADMIHYYNKKGASTNFVRNDKQKAFNVYDSMKINLSNMRVSPDDSGENATAIFDKEWVFEGAGKYNAGKVQTQLRLKKIGGDWRITGERDLKVYYVDK